MKLIVKILPCMQPGEPVLSQGQAPVWLLKNMVEVC